MIAWELLARAAVPLAGGGELTLHRRGGELSIRIDGRELMNSRLHASEDALAELVCKRLRRAAPRVLVAGLGMGYTLAAALAVLPASAEVVQCELVADVVAWNRELLGALAGHPLDDPRVHVEVADVGAVMRASVGRYDAIVLDVDNDPDDLTEGGNGWLYGGAGLAAAFAALRKGGVLGVWSAAPSSAFTRRLRRAGFDVEETTVRARTGKGARHTLWIATR